jgi:hypothetical protein
MACWATRSREARPGCRAACCRAQLSRWRSRAASPPRWSPPARDAACATRWCRSFTATPARLRQRRPVGVEVGGAVKNVLAIATGLCDGLGLGLNARAALITRGLAEMTRLGLALGARAETFMGLSGLGDLVLTATGDLSRNRRSACCWPGASAADRPGSRWAMWPRAFTARTPRCSARSRGPAAWTCRSPTPWWPCWKAGCCRP